MHEETLQLHCHIKMRLGIGIVHVLDAESLSEVCTEGYDDSITLLAFMYARTRMFARN